MSIYDNVLAGNQLNSKRMKKAEADAIVEKSLRGANLWTEVKDRLDKPGMGLSGGQQQRLCIARAIAVEPQVLLMDEPCSALDPISTSAIEDLIHELKADYTIVIVTHNMQQAARVSDETGFFNLKAAGQPGHLVEFNAPRRCSATPTTRPPRPTSPAASAEPNWSRNGSVGFPCRSSGRRRASRGCAHLVHRWLGSLILQGNLRAPFLASPSPVLARRDRPRP